MRARLTPKRLPMPPFMQVFSTRRGLYAVLVDKIGILWYTESRKHSLCAKGESMKKALVITGIVLASLALVFGAFAVVNQLGEKQMNKYIDSFASVSIEEPLTPTLENGEYYFTTDREFRVMQLTDVHLGGGFLSRKEDKMAINAIAAMVTEEKPDLIIVTGDVSFAVPYISGTINNAIAHRMFMRLMERLGVSWTIVFGNHDSEAYNYYNSATVSEMYDDASLKHCLFIPDGDLSGEGNHVINIKNSAGLITESFYMIDTHSYTDKDPLGIKWDYDYVKEDQIAWYAGKIGAHKATNAAVYATLSDEQKTAYANLLEPKSLMFMHIPLREVKYAYEESISNGKKDTGNHSLSHLLSSLDRPPNLLSRLVYASKARVSSSYPKSGHKQSETHNSE